MRNHQGLAARLLVLAALVGPACASSSSDDAAGSGVPAAVALGLPDVPAGRQLASVLADPPSAGDDDPRFASTLPVADVADALEALGGVEVVGIDHHEETEEGRLDVVVRSSIDELTEISIAVADGEPHVIEELTVAAAAIPASPTSWAEVDDRLDQLAATTSLLAAEVSGDGTFVVVHDRAPDDVQPIGSAFRLFVLGMVSDRIGGGDLAWSDELTIDDRTRSYPSGELRDRPNGSTVTVAEAAQLMMSTADTTATDLLIAAVGRELIEGILPVMGLGEEALARTSPLLTTREHAILAWASEPDQRQKYADAETGERRTLIAGLAAGLPPLRSYDPTDPQAVASIGWFASASELARAQLWVDSQRGLPGQEPLEQILDADGGIVLDPATWPRYSVTKGSEPGVMALSWLLTRSDGRRYVVSILGNHASGQVDEREARSIAAGVLDLVATS